MSCFDWAAIACSIDGVAVAEGGDADAAEQIEIVVAVLVGEVDAVAAGEEDRIAFVGVQEQLLFGGLQGFEFCHATITSVPFVDTA